jgi:hypothetical protein
VALGIGQKAAEMRASMSQIGVSGNMLKTMGAGEIIFGAIAQKIRGLDPQTVAGPMRQIFNRGFGEMVPMIKQDLDALGQQMSTLGLIIDTETAAKLKILNNEFTLISNFIVASLAPALVQFGMGLIRAIVAIKGYSDYLDKFRQQNYSKDFGGGFKMWWDQIRASELRLVNPSSPWLKKFDAKSVKALESSSVPADEAALKKFQDDMAKLIVDLKNPKPTSDFAATPAMRALYSVPMDSLVRVGNFLGTGKDKLADLANEQVRLQRQMVELLKRPPAARPMSNTEVFQAVFGSPP